MDSVRFVCAKTWKTRRWIVTSADPSPAKLHQSHPSVPLHPVITPIDSPHQNILFFLILKTGHPERGQIDSTINLESPRLLACIGEKHDMKATVELKTPALAQSCAVPNRAND
jgi:hypothetical protein